MTHNTPILKMIVQYVCKCFSIDFCKKEIISYDAKRHQGIGEVYSHKERSFIKNDIKIYNYNKDQLGEYKIDYEIIESSKNIPINKGAAFADVSMKITHLIVKGSQKDMSLIGIVALFSIKSIFSEFPVKSNSIPENNGMGKDFLIEVKIKDIKPIELYSNYISYQNIHFLIDESWNQFIKKYNDYALKEHASYGNS